MTARLVPPATEDALRLLLDDGEADARANATLATELQRRHHHSSRLLNTPSASPTPEESGDVELLVASGRPDAETAVEATGASVTSDQAWVNGERQPGRQEELEVMDEALKWGLWHKGEVRASGAAEIGRRGGGGGVKRGLFEPPVRCTCVSPRRNRLHLTTICLVAVFLFAWFGVLDELRCACEYSQSGGRGQKMSMSRLR